MHADDVVETVPTVRPDDAFPDTCAADVAGGEMGRTPPIRSRAAAVEPAGPMVRRRGAPVLLEPLVAAVEDVR